MLRPLVIGDLLMLGICFLLYKMLGYELTYGELAAIFIYYSIGAIIAEIFLKEKEEESK